MTAIAGFTVNTVPVIIGDILLSTKGDVGFSMKIPGSGQNSVEFAEERSIEYYPAKLSQKVSIINDHLLIATAGSYKTSKEFVEFLKDDYEINTNPAWKDILDCIKTFEYDDEDEFSFILYYYNQEENISAWTSHNTESVEVEGFDGLVVAGSGSDDLIKALSDVDIAFEDGTAEGVKAALTVNGIISRLWSLDITDQKNIEEGFGGGYEIGTLKNNKVCKVGDFLFLEIFISGPPEKMLIGLNTRIAKFDYLDDDFIIRIMHLMPEEGKPVEELNEKMHIPMVENRGSIMPPIDFVGEYVIDEDKLKKLPDFNAEFSNIHLQVDAENGQHLSAVFTEWRPKRNSPIEFNGNDFFITPDLWKKILIQANDFLKGNTLILK